MDLTTRQFESVSVLRENLDLIRRRLLGRRRLMLLLHLVSLVPFAAVVPTLLVRLLTEYQPLPYVLPAIMLVMLLELLLVRRPRDLRTTARHADRLLGFDQRLATGTDLLLHPVPSRLAPLVLAEAAQDSHTALTTPWPRVPVRRPALLGLLALVLILLSCALPSAGILRLWNAWRAQRNLQATSVLLTSTSRQLQNVPQLPGHPLSSLRLNVRRLAQDTAAGALTPEAARREIESVRHTMRETDWSADRERFEDRLGKLSEAELLNPLINAVRQGNTAAGENFSASLQQRFDQGTVSPKDLDQLRSTLENFAGDTDDPGLAESTHNLLASLPPEGSGQFQSHLDELTRRLLSERQTVRAGEELLRNVRVGLRRASDVLAGIPAAPGAPVSGQEILTPALTPAASGSPPLTPPVGPLADPALSRRILTVTPVTQSDGQRELEPAGYHRYLMRYFTSDDDRQR